MIALGIVLTLAGVFAFWAGLSNYKNRNNQTMPLVVRGIFQSVSTEMGIALMFVGGAVGVGGIGILISRLLSL